MLTTNKTPLDDSETREFVTSGSVLIPTNSYDESLLIPANSCRYIGNLPGDPRGGATRIVTNNGGEANSGTPIFYMGVQANGSTFLDSAGKMDFAGAGEIGMLDWGAFAPSNGAAGAKGTKALNGKLSRGLSMARTLGGDPNQVAKPGRRTLVGWGSASYTFQTLLQDLTLGGMATAPFLQQQFIPELQMLREGSTGLATSQQFEVVARITKPSTAAAAHVSGTCNGTTPWTCAHSAYFTVLGHTKIGACFDSDLVFVDTSAQPKIGKPNKLGTPGVRAGPLYGDPTKPIHVHLIVDHCIIAVIFNNRTSLTVQVTPGRDDGGVTKGPGTELQAWTLKTANENTQKTPTTPWLKPQIHNAPACL
jgi:hypothetical protein